MTAVENTTSIMYMYLAYMRCLDTLSLEIYGISASEGPDGNYPYPFMAILAWYNVKKGQICTPR